MSDLREIYQQVVLDHNKSPRNFCKIEDANRHADGYNPLCGDRISVDLRIEDDAVKAIGFQGQGCAICTASASIMTQAVKGKSEEDVHALFHGFHRLVTEEERAESEEEKADLGKLKVFSGVREFPMRVKCATLPWHTLHSAMTDADAPVSTE